MKTRLTYQQLGAPQAPGNVFVPGLGRILLNSRILDDWKSCSWRGAIELRWFGWYWMPLDIVLLGYEAGR